ncbi:MAG: flagellar protein FlgN [Syntrophaceae bacterium]
MLSCDTQGMNEVDVNADLDGHMDSLLGVMRKEIEAYGELADAIEGEKGVLAKPSLESLNESNTRKETCILKIRILEELRMRVLGRIAAALGIDECNLHLQSILPHARGNLRQSLRECQAELRSLLARINEENRRNRALLDASLSGVRTTRHFMENLIGSGSTYMGSGELNNGGLSGRLYSERG